MRGTEKKMPAGGKIYEMSPKAWSDGASMKAVHRNEKGQESEKRRRWDNRQSADFMWQGSYIHTWASFLQLPPINSS